MRIPSDGAEDWDRFVRNQDGWTPYHLYGWRSVLEDVYGHECVYLGATVEGAGLRGVLPLVRVRSRLFGHFLVSMPFLSYGGPLGDRDAVQALSHEAVRMADAGGVDLLELRSGRDLSLDLSLSRRKVTVRLALPEGDPDELWGSLKAKVRSQIRRPMKEGMEARFGADELDAFYSVFSQHMRDLGTPVQAKQFFRRAREAMGHGMWFGSILFEGRPVAAGCGFRWSDRFELVWASALREYNRQAPNMLLYWRFIERCIVDGVRDFDFGRCTPGAGPHRFKRQWGGRDHDLWWYQHGPRSGGGTPSPDSGLYALGPKVWSRLPLGVATALGPKIVRFIP